MSCCDSNQCAGLCAALNELWVSKDIKLAYSVRRLASEVVDVILSFCLVVRWFKICGRWDSPRSERNTGINVVRRRVHWMHFNTNHCSLAISIELWKHFGLRVKLSVTLAGSRQLLDEHRHLKAKIVGSRFISWRLSSSSAGCQLRGWF